MVRASEVLYYTIHFQQLRNILQWSVTSRHPDMESFIIDFFKEAMA